MVSGLEKFREWFESYSTRYAIIGGTACNLIFAEYGAPERATHDIDMVIVAEAFDRSFYDRFIAFIRAGGYRHRNKADKYELYRFESPADAAFPPKIELLSKRPENLAGIEAELGRFKTVDASGSLSAILLDDEYYGLLADGIQMVGGFPVLSLDYLPVFKIHAWANLTDDKASGKTVHSDEINKHRRDVLRLCALFEPGRRVELPESIKEEVGRFVAARPWDDNMMRNLRLGASAEEMAGLIRSVYL
ncbi:hypothetical protein [Paratractidigestivibacter sp.]|uniref:hypothetical protein n=1 Tax=Paratractidigestivibacter sp. TaxID=2847316 RepID=UPI002ACB10AA|nr:hypothetical protein [Paratractidigestivibacter sp.]